MKILVSDPCSEEEWSERARRAEYNVSLLARGIGCSVKQLERFFVKRMRMNPHDWMTLARKAATVEGLRTDLRVKEAADQAGYRTAAHYSREFKKVHGVTPTQVAYGAKVAGENV